MSFQPDPTGVVDWFPGSSAPAGWLFCDGSAISRTMYGALFGVIGTTFGVGDGSTTFNLPDLRQRFPLGKASTGTGSSLGDTGGSIDHTHVGGSHSHTGGSHAHIGPSHSHGVAAIVVGAAGTAGTNADDAVIPQQQQNIPNNTHRHGLSGTTDLFSGTTTANTITTDAGGAVNTGTTNPPFLVVQYIIKT